MANVTLLLKRIDAGDRHAAEDLLPLVYEELRILAAARMAHEAPGQTLQATALVHDAYVRLVDQKQADRWANRAHFFAAAAEAMRRILIEQARRKRSLKHGGESEKVQLSIDPVIEVEDSHFDILDLNDALERFAVTEPQKAQLVNLRYFAGLSLEDAAAALGISLRTATRYWTYSRAWLFGELSGGTDR